MIKTIYIDMDGVLADFVGGCETKFDRLSPYVEKCADFEKYLGGMGGIPHAWGMTMDDLWRPIERDPTFWSGLALLPGAIQIYQTAVSLVGQDNVHILSSHGGLRKCIDGKMDWLEKYFPFIHLSHNYHFAVKKWHFAAHDRLLVDDQDNNVDPFRQKGGQTILVPRAWNSRYKERHVSVPTTVNEMRAYFVRKTNDQ